MDPRAYLKIEMALTKRLQKAWGPLAAQVFSQVTDAMEDSDYAAAYDFAGQLDFSVIRENHYDWLKYQLFAAAKFGAQMVAKDTALETGSYEILLGQAADALLRDVEVSAFQAAYTSLAQLIAARQYPEMVKKADTFYQGQRYVKEFVSFKSDADARLQLISSLHSSRLAVWGFTAEADVRGVTQYRLTAVLDGRTSHYCRYVAHGKTFEVEDARSSINRILQAQDAETVKNLHPWPKQDAKTIKSLREMSAADLTALGYHIPPFHPLCRTLCAVAGRKVIGEPRKEMEQQRVLTPQTPKEFDAIGVNITPKQLDLWNSTIGQPPAAVASKLTGLSPDDLIKPKAPFEMRVGIGDEDTIKLKVSGPLAGPTSQVEMQVVYDNFSKTLYGNYLEIGASPGATTGFLEGHLKRSVELAKLLEADSYVVKAGGRSGVYNYAKMGFVPANQEEWIKIQTNIEEALKEGGELAKHWPSDPTEQQNLNAILDMNNPKGIYALAFLPYGDQLLAKWSIQMLLDIEDAAVMEVFFAAFP